MKKFISLLSVFIIILSLSSCKKGKLSEQVVIENMPETMWEGETIKVSGKYVGNEGRYLYEWSSSDDSIASVISTTDGVEVLFSDATIQTHKRGTVTITLKIYTKGKSSAPEYKNYTLKVINDSDRPDVENFNFDFSSLTLKIGESFDLKPNVSPSNAIFKETLSFISENPEIVSVDFTGKLTAHKKGTSVVSVMYNGKFLDIDVSVIHVADSIDITINGKKNPETITLNKGNRVYYNVSFTPSNTDTVSFDFIAGNPNVILSTKTYFDALTDGESLFTVYSTEYPALRRTIKVIVNDPSKPAPPPIINENE